MGAKLVAANQYLTTGVTVCPAAGGGGELALYGWHHHAAQVAPVAQARLMPQGSNGQGSLQSQVLQLPKSSELAPVPCVSLRPKSGPIDSFDSLTTAHCRLTRVVRQVASIEAAYLLDSLASKASALACAVDAACMLCRVCATVEES